MARPDDAGYMTVKEFAALPAAAHHAVWKAAGEGRVAVIPAGGSSVTRRYHRAQVLALLGGGVVSCPEAGHRKVAS